MSPADSDFSPRRPRWCTAEAPAPRLAYNGAAEAYPALPTARWCRLYRLMAARELLADGCALRLAGFLADTDTVDEHGVIADVPAMLRAYAARARVSVQTGYTDLRRLTGRGLVRQVQAAAPGHAARYRLSAPAAMIAEHMPGLPGELARAIGRHRPAPEPARDPPSGPDSCGELDTSPLTREGSPPSSRGTGPRRAPRSRRCRPGGISDEEKHTALSVMSACQGDWLAQRGQLGVPGPGQLARVVPLAALALRHVPAGEVAQLLTWQVASAADLPGVLAWRLGRVITAARRPPPRHVPADETGARRAAMLAARAGNSAPDPHGSTPGAVELRAVRAKLGPDRLARRRHDYEALAAEQAAESRAARERSPRALQHTDR